MSGVVCMWTGFRSLAGRLAVIVLAAIVSAAPVGAARASAQPIGQADKIKEKLDQQEQVRATIRKQLGPRRSYALVIGISQFDVKGWKNLPGVDVEAVEVVAALQNHGFTVVPGPAAGRMTKAELKKAIEDFVRAYGKFADNRLVVYVATHGYADVRDPNGYGYLVASDSRVPGEGFESTAYSVKELEVALQGIQAQHVYLFFNACFSGALVPSGTRSGPKTETTRPKPVEALSEETARWTLDLLAHNARLVLTAGSDKQEVPDKNNPFSKAVIDGLNGLADADADGLILGTELAQYVRGRVARETRKKNRPNDAVFAVLPKIFGPEKPRADLPAEEAGRLDYGLQGDFVFVSPRGPGGEEGLADVDAVTEARRQRLPTSQFTDCQNCPIMVEIPEEAKDRGDDPVGARKTLAMARTETTFAEWDACYRELGCRRYLDDGGLGRGDRPVAGVTYADALEYVTWLNTQKDRRCGDYSLPTEAQWSHAAAAGSQTRFFWGDEPETERAVCWGCGEGAGFDGSAPIRTASLPANGFGLHDMTGNLWEWVREDAAPVCDLGTIRERGICEPGKVMGGSYATSVSDLRTLASGSALRTGNENVVLAGGAMTTAPFRSPAVGFRVACSLKPE